MKKVVNKIAYVFVFPIIKFLQVLCPHSTLVGSRKGHSTVYRCSVCGKVRTFITTGG